MIVAIDSERALDKAQHAFMGKKKKKTSQRVAVEGALLSTLKATLKESIGHLELIGPKLSALPPRVGVSQGCKLSPQL